MTDYGLITPAQDWPERPPSYLLQARQQWSHIAGGTPALYPVLHRLGSSPVEHWRGMKAELGSVAALYLTTWDDVDGILAGHYDDEIAKLAAAIDDDTLVRINHEPDAEHWEAAWWTSKWAPRQWADVFSYIQHRIGGWAWACFIWHGKDRELGLWKPDSSLPYLSLIDADVIGFDIYVKDIRKRDGRIVPLEKRIQPGVDWLIERTGKPVYLGEVGVITDEDQWQVLRRLRRVERLAGVVYMDWGAHKLTGESREGYGRWMRTVAPGSPSGLLTNMRRDPLSPGVGLSVSVAEGVG